MTHDEDFKKSESASRPLMGFGELNDNMIKGIVSIEEIMSRDSFVKELMSLAHVMKNQMKGKYCRKNDCKASWSHNGMTYLLIYH